MDPTARDIPHRRQGQPTPGDYRSKLVRMSDHKLPLPRDITPGEWALERVRWQNPRIRAFLSCIRLLEGVLDSNYAILHCSPQRLAEIWRQVGRAAKLIRTELTPALSTPSRIPALEMARRRAEIALRINSNTVLAELERFPDTLAVDQMLEVRKLLCVSMGKLHAFLQDTFCQIMAADPRSRHDADYYLSKRFPKDIEEAEWLLTTVERLEIYLEGLTSGRYTRMRELETMLRSERTIPNGKLWDEVSELLDEFENVLTPLVKEVLALRGIRFDEMEVLDRYAFEIPATCRLMTTLHDTAHEVTDGILGRALEVPGNVDAHITELTASHAVFARRIAELLADLDQSFQDLTAFVPLWLESIELRRALLLKRAPEPS